METFDLVLPREGTLRFGELQRLIPGNDQKMLTQHLRDLERYEIVHRKIYAEVPPKVENFLTRHGQSLKPILKLMSGVGHQTSDSLWRHEK